jgi:hypothetical protein
MLLVCLQAARHCPRRLEPHHPPPLAENFQGSGPGTTAGRQASHWQLAFCRLPGSATLRCAAAHHPAGGRASFLLGVSDWLPQRYLIMCEPAH